MNVPIISDAYKLPFGGDAPFTASVMYVARHTFLDLKWEHPFFGMLNWREWFLFLGVHCTDHAIQIRAASPASG
jgi:hypothetical protein